MWKKGDMIEDMHYGIAPIMKKYDVLSHTRFNLSRDKTEKGSPWLEDSARQFTFWLQTINSGYINKMLMITDSYPNAFGFYTAVYEYDEVFAGIIVLRKKGE